MNNAQAWRGGRRKGVARRESWELRRNLAARPPKIPPCLHLQHSLLNRRQRVVLGGHRVRPNPKHGAAPRRTKPAVRYSDPYFAFLTLAHVYALHAIVAHNAAQPRVSN